ncbi:MAG: MATE family efflux transporter, partial [Dorea sp.]
MDNIRKSERKNYLFDNKALVALIIPLIIEQLLAVLVGMADSIMIASVGESAVSGVSLVDQIMVLLINIFAALATGGAVVAGQYLGQKKKEAACRSATQLVWFITLCAIVITVIVYAGKYVILHKIFGQIEADVMGHANT